MSRVRFAILNLMITSIKKRPLFSLLVLGVLLVALVLGVNLVQRAQYYLSEASEPKANIQIDTAVDQGPIEPIWQGLAQGGEERTDMLADVIPQVTQLQPRYIRIDHIYDFYEVVTKTKGQLVFDWTKLDQVIDTILKIGARPFFSLSYMPASVAQDGVITNPPVDWTDWQQIVKATIEHYSGRDQRNLSGIYYEVWNEPDLFGNWRLGTDKDYRDLYRHAAHGASQVRNVNPFKLGGPATTAPYKNWLNHFLDFVDQEDLRLDFYSWHRYSLDPKEFISDVNRLDNWLADHGGRYLLEKHLTEWGSISENSPYHDNQFDAAHTIAVIRQLLQRVDLTYAFEIKDGPSPEQKNYWGRWGLLTHQGQPKPRYQAINLLNQLTGQRLKLTGESHRVTGFATDNQIAYFLILSNLDINQHYVETVPITFINLKDGQYLWEETALNGNQQTKTFRTNQGKLSSQVILNPNQVILIKLTETDQSRP